MAEEKEIDDDANDIDSDDDIITCWCGAQGTYDQLFGSDFLDEGCGGTGSLNCYCGGDSCVCHWHGATECPGCDDCEGDEEDFYDDDD